MKVYVCVCEDEYDVRQVTHVFSSLDRAQEEMRVELDGYLERNPSRREDIDWHSGLSGVWGWYDTCCPNGYYIYEKEVKE